MIASVTATFVAVSAFCAPVYATSVEEVKKQQDETNKQINDLNNQVSSLQSERAAVSNEISALDNQLVDILTSISICEDEIAAKEDEIFEVKGQLKEAEDAELIQYENMKTRIRFMYEKGDTAYMQIFMAGGSISDMINKASYAEKIYEYDRDMLDQYAETKNQIASLKEQLEIEEADLVASQGELKEEKANLETIIDEKKATVANFDQQLASAKQRVESCKKQLKEQTKKIKDLEEAERKAKEEKEKKQKAAQEAEKVELAKKNAQQTINEAYNNTTTGSDDVLQTASIEDIEVGVANEKTSASVGNSALGSQIASYACNFIGNPYVPGGTSLTDGADCSGFTQAVYAHFGIKIPRDSTSQRLGGTAVDYSQAQPGDIICYAGHVAIYIGNGQIVHASTQKTGIKIGTATYRTILGVRRYT